MAEAYFEKADGDDLELLEEFRKADAMPPEEKANAGRAAGLKSGRMSASMIGVTAVGGDKRSTPSGLRLSRGEE